MIMGKRMTEILTGADSSVLDPAYVWWALTVLVGLSLEIYSVMTGAKFDLQAYGIGVGALLAGGGFAKSMTR